MSRRFDIISSIYKNKVFSENTVKISCILDNKHIMLCIQEFDEESRYGDSINGKCIGYS